jgi:hypothetical protein
MANHRPGRAFANPDKAGEKVSIIEQALVQWRRKRSNVSEHRETNIEAWLVELQTVLAEHGLGEGHIEAYRGTSLRGLVEREYAEEERRGGALSSH